MYYFKKTFIILFLALMAAPPLLAQDISTQGKEFWFSYMHNGFKNHPDGGWVKTQVLISAKRDCTGTISNPNSGWQESFAVQANNITTIDVPNEQCYHNADNYEYVDNKGIKIVATDTISVYSTNIAQVSFDASFVLPTESLSDDYIIQTYDQAADVSMNSYVNDNLTSAFLIVATEDDTQIDITPSVKTMTNNPAGHTFSITLNAGQTFHVRSNRNSTQRDLSGSRVTAHDCKKIAVFNGNTLTCVPTNFSNGFDHVYEQAMPLRSWGKNFVVTTSFDRENDYVKITSAYNDNVITKNGEPLVTLQANQSYTFKIRNDELSCFLSATQICAVYLYHQSFQNSYNNQFGDPSMVWISPIEQRIDEVTFSTFDNAQIDIQKHYVNIIVKTEDIDSVYFDGRLLHPNSFMLVNGNNDYSFSSEEIEHNVHHIKCAHGFNAHVYGFGDAKGYAYMVGSKAIDLSTKITANEESVKPYDTYHSCTTKTVEFFAKVNFPDFDIQWDFGDGQTSSQNPVTHTYTDEQVYPANVVITTDEAGCTAAESDTTYFYVSIGHEYHCIIDTTACSPYYIGDVLFDESGHFEHHATTASGCDSIFDLTLDLHYTPDPTEIIPLDSYTPHWLVPATEFQLNSYTFRIEDNNPRCVWDKVQWELSDNCTWMLSVSDDQKSCELFDLEYMADTVWLSATVTNGCDTIGKTRKYWLVCSFYGMEEQTASLADFSVVPNPNNGDMELNFEHLTGQVELRVYNMNGNLVDSFETFNEVGPNTKTYSIKNRAPGIYHFVATAKEGTIAKKVIITL